MIDFQIFLLDLFVNIVEIQFVLRYYLSIYKTPNLSLKKLCIMSCLLMVTVTSILRVVLNPMRPVSLPLITILSSLVLLPFFRSRWEKKVLFSFLLIGVSSSWVFLLDYLITPLPNKNIFVIYLVFHGGFWVLLELLKRVGKSENQIIPTSIWILLNLIAASNCAVIMIIQINSMQRDNPYLLTTEIPVLIAFLMINLTLFIFFDRFSEMVQKIKEQSLLEQQINLQNENYKQLEEYHNQISSLHHDMRNHIEAAMSMAKTDHENEELIEYLQSVNDTLLQAEKIISTGNPKLDSVLNLKLSQLRYAGIKYDTKIHIPSGLALSFEDSVVIFGNLLDNGREACEKLSNKNKWIHITIIYNNGTLYIKIDNPIPNCEIKTDKEAIPFTTKVDQLFHGIGLKNVKQIVKKRGTLYIDYSNPRIFSVRIVLYDL